MATRTSDCWLVGGDKKLFIENEKEVLTDAAKRVVAVTDTWLISPEHWIEETTFYIILQLLNFGWSKTLSLQ